MRNSNGKHCERVPGGKPALSDMPYCLGPSSAVTEVKAELAIWVEEEF
jgi:hypothetical protein